MINAIDPDGRVTISATLRVVKILKKSSASLLKELEVDDIITISKTLNYSNAAYLTVKTPNGEENKHITILGKSLRSFELEEVDGGDIGEHATRHIQKLEELNLDLRNQVRRLEQR